MDDENGARSLVESDPDKRVVYDPKLRKAIYKSLFEGNHKKDLPKIVEHELGDHWYTGMAKTFSKTGLGRRYMAQKFMDRYLPKVDGDSELARQFLAHGGNV